MELNVLQEKSVEAIGRIDRKRHLTHDKKVTLYHLVEELGEIAREMYNEETGREKINIENMSGELADLIQPLPHADGVRKVIMLLSHLAHLYGIRIEEAVKAKMGSFRERFGVEVSF